MRFVIDTHTFIWFVAGAPDLSATAASMIGDPVNDILVSAATVWEMAIKYGKGKLNLSDPPTVYVPHHLYANSMGLLNIELRHIFRAGSLPDHHRDPFDRMLVAQSLVEGIPIISRDPVLDAYGVTRIW